MRNWYHVESVPSSLKWVMNYTLAATQYIWPCTFPLSPRSLNRLRASFSPPDQEGWKVSFAKAPKPSQNERDLEEDATPYRKPDNMLWHPAC